LLEREEDEVDFELDEELWELLELVDLFPALLP